MSGYCYDLPHFFRKEMSRRQSCLSSPSLLTHTSGWPILTVGYCCLVRTFRCCLVQARRLHRQVELRYRSVGLWYTTIVLFALDSFRLRTLANVLPSAVRTCARTHVLMNVCARKRPPPSIISFLPSHTHTYRMLHEYWQRSSIKTK